MFYLNVILNVNRHVWGHVEILIIQNTHGHPAEVLTIT